MKFHETWSLVLTDRKIQASYTYFISNITNMRVTVGNKMAVAVGLYYLANEMHTWIILIS
jgi:hypothetical protein